MKGLIITYVLTYGGSVAALVNPFYGLLIYIAFAIIKPAGLWHWSVQPGYYSRIIAIAMLIGWVFHGMGRWEFGRAKGILLAFFGFLAWAILSALFSATDKAIAWSAVEGLAKIFLPFLVGLTIIDSVKKLKILAWVILLSQSFLAYEVNVSYFIDGFNVMGQFGVAGIDNNTAAIAMSTTAGLAFFLCLNADQPWQKVLAAVCGVLLVHAIMMSNSRGGMLSLVCTAVVSFVLLPKKPKHYLLFAAALLISLRLAGQGPRERFATIFIASEERDGSAQSRLDLWASCWNVIQERPILGIGPNHFPLIAHEHGFAEGKEVHSTWVQTAVEWGIPGMLFLVAFYVLCMTRMWRLARLRVPENSAAAFQPLIGRIVLASLAGFAVCASFVTVWGIEIPYYIVLLGAGSLLPTVAREIAETSAATEEQHVVSTENCDHIEEDATIVSRDV